MEEVFAVYADKAGNKIIFAHKRLKIPLGKLVQAIVQKALTSDVRPKCGESVKKVYGGFTMIEKILGVQPAFLNQIREKARERLV